MKRRHFLASPLLLVAADAIAIDYPAVVPGYLLTFPRDHGSHPAYRTEWWYLTGWVRDAGGTDYGIQITFFRTRPGVAEANSSAFAPRQLLLAHAAVADSRIGRLRHDQRVARAGFGLADAAEETTRVWIGDWSLQLAQDAYTARIVARDFAFDLRFAPTQPILLQGDAGLSRKGPNRAQASYYYSRPQLKVSGDITVAGNVLAVTGNAWLDHEWSSEALASDAVGWDWAGINLTDGGALMAFRIRDRDGGALWAGGSLRTADRRTRIFPPEDIRFTPQRNWRSPRTQVEYPVAMIIRAGDDDYVLEPMLDDQELDSRASTGTIYWEGAVRALRSGQEVGRGYLELTGYWQRLRF
jgi:predicted secreted hydrolase